MADSISAVHIKAYTDLVLMRAQQMESRLRPWAKIKDNVRGESVSFDRIGKVEMQGKASRHAPTPNADPNHERRWATLATWHTNVLLDADDVQAALTDPTSDYVQTVSAAIGRKYDERILSAALGTATTGVIGPGGDSTHTGSETWPVTDRKSVSHQIAAGGTGFTVGKWRKGVRILDVLQAERDRVLVIDAYALEDLLETTEVTSSDYNTVKALVQGDLNSFLGCQVVQVDSDLMTTSGTTYSAVLMVRGSVGLGIGIDKKIRIDERSDLSYANQVYAEMMTGAVRRDGERIVEIQYVAS